MAYEPGKSRGLQKLINQNNSMFTLMNSRHFTALVFFILLSGSVLALDFGEGPLTVDFNLVPEPPLFLGENIEKIEIEVLYPNGESVPLERLNTPTLRIGEKRQSLELVEENGKLVAKVDHAIGLTEIF